MYRMVLVSVRVQTFCLDIRHTVTKLEQFKISSHKNPLVYTPAECQKEGLYHITSLNLIGKR